MKFFRQFVLPATGLLLAALLVPEAFAQQGEIHSIPYKTEEIDIVSMMLRAVFFVIVLGALAAGGLWAGRKYLPALRIGRIPHGPQRIKVLEIRRLTPKTILFLVEVDGHVILLGQGDGLRAFEFATGAGTVIPSVDGGTRG